MWQSEGHLVKRIMIEKQSGKKSLGRPRQRWIDTMKKDLTSTNVTFNIDMATDRDQC